MRTPDGLFFAPGLRFKDLDLDDSTALADALDARARSWFLEPARRVAQMSPFASGVIICCFIDAAAEFEGIGIADWVRGVVAGTGRQDPRRTNKTIADSFEEDVRHGLVHHGRLNRGAEFSLDLETPMEIVDSVLVVNPLQLVEAVEAAWQVTLGRIRSNAEVHDRIRKQVRRVFRVDFEADQTWTRNGTGG